MKGRSGFVSNSSTASFVLIGFDASELVDKDIPVWEDERFYNEDGDREVIGLFSDEDGLPSGIDLVLGEYIFWASSDNYAASETTEIGPVMERVRQLRDKYGVDAPILAWSGTAMS